MSRAARGDADLRAQLLEHLVLIGLSGDGTLIDVDSEATATQNTVRRVLTNLVAQTNHTDEDRAALRRRDTEGDDERLARWAALQPFEARREPESTRADLLGLRLAMGEVDAIDEVISAAGGGTLRTIVSHLGRFEATEPQGLALNVERLAAAYPTFDAEVLVRRTEVALWKRHLFGCLTADDIQALGLTPAPHPCGIDLNASGTRDFLATGGRVLTGRDVAVPMMVEWGRHEFFDWGEDEEVLFFPWDRPALEATLADPWCVKREEVEGYLERL